MTIIDCNNPDDECWKYDLINLNTQEKINNVIWANDKTGEYEIIQFDTNNKIILDENEKLITLRKYENIKIIKSETWHD